MLSDVDGAVINPGPPRPSGMRVLDRIPDLTTRTPVGVLTGWTTECSGRPDPRTGADSPVSIASDGPGRSRNAPCDCQPSPNLCARRRVLKWDPPRV